MPYTVAHVDDIEPAGPGNIVRFVRRELGVEAFGVNRFDLPPNGHWTIDGEDVPVREGSFIRIDPESTRCPHAGPDGLSFIAMGTRPGSYEPHGPF